jgi:hypothetical protein
VNPGTLNLSTSILFFIAQANIQVIVLDKRDEDLSKDLKFKLKIFTVFLYIERLL